MADVTVQINGLNKLTALAEKYPAVSEKYINTAINRSLVRVLGAEKTQAPVGVTGNLRDNWRIDIRRFEGSLKSNAPYAANVQTGQQLSQFPSGESLKAWAEKKGLNPFAVANAIKKRGHLIQNPFLTRAVQQEKENINIEFKNAGDSILREIAS